MAVSTVIDRLDQLFVQQEDHRTHAPTQQQQQQTPHAPPRTFVTHAQELAALDRFIDNEIRDRVGAPNMTWRKLDACFKWRALQEYMVARGVTAGGAAFAQVRGLLQERQLDAVEYDAGARKIKRINHAACAALDMVEP